MRGVGISLDVTERRTLEAQYQQAQKMEAIGRLAGGVAHDFNNLLTVILGYCELLLDGSRRARSAAAGHRGDPESRRAGRRRSPASCWPSAASRSSSRRCSTSTRSSTDLRPMLERLIGEDVKVMVVLGPGMRLRQGRSRAARAGRHEPRGERPRRDAGRRHVDDRKPPTSNSTSTTRRCTATVKPGPLCGAHRDRHGHRHDAEVQAQLFEPFFTTKEVGKGTGLGLATVHGIVSGAAAPSASTARSAKAASFKVYFPRAEAAGRRRRRRRR